MRYDYHQFETRTPPELGGPGQAQDCYDVAIIGAGPVGLAAAIDLASHGIASVVLDDNNVVSVGSRAICWSKRTLEIFDRLGVGQRMLDKGVTWKVGRLFHGDDAVYSFDLLPEDGHKYPAFINLQQYYVEQYLVERAQQFPDLIDLRFRNKVADHTDHGEHVTLKVQADDGAYQLDTKYVLACDGAGSPTRRRMGLSFEGQTFEEHFLIIDVEMPESPFETETPERWFWFEPSFHPGQSALLHKQPDDIYRIDLQLGPGADPKVEATEEKVVPRLKAIVGDKPFTIDWMSVYKFRCAKLDRFVHGRVIFVGDSAHVVSPFGARGGNGGIQDVDNLCWKLASVLSGKASSTLLESYDAERLHGANENILNSSRATNFMTPKSPIEALFRNEVLRLARQDAFARRLINSGRLSVPCVLEGMALQTPGAGPVTSGTAAVDAPLADGWLLEKVQGQFTLIGFGDVALPVVDCARLGIAQQHSDYTCIEDPTGLALQRYGEGIAYLFRPDGHVAASFSHPSTEMVTRALRRAQGLSPEKEAAA